MRGLDRLAVLVADRHLALGVGPERAGLARAARFRHQLENAMGIVERCRHQFRCFTAGVAEHDALVAGTLVLVARGVDALGDIARLGVQINLDRSLFPVKSGLLVADIFDREACEMGNVIARDRGRSAGLAGNHHAVRGRKRFARNPDLARVPAVARCDVEKRVDDLV